MCLCQQSEDSLPPFKERNPAVLLILCKEYHILLPAEAIPVSAYLLRGLTLSDSVERKARLISSHVFPTLLQTGPEEFMPLHV